MMIRNIILWVGCCSFISVLLSCQNKEVSHFQETQASQEIEKMVSAVYQKDQYTLPGYEKIKGKKTGFFHVEKINGVWWLIDPNGLGSYARAVNQFAPQGWASSKKNGERYYPYNEHIMKKYGSVEKWAEASALRVRQWGFNTVTSAHGNPDNYSQPVTYCTHLKMGTYFVRRNKLAADDCLVQAGWGSLPNVFSPDWKPFCERLAKKVCAPKKDTPWLLGYFIDNERAWLEADAFVQRVMTYSSKHTGKKAMVELAQDHFGSIEVFNKSCNTKFDSFEALLKSETPFSTLNKKTKDFCEKFLRLTAEKYYKTTTDAIRKYDPNHMIIGVRDAKKEKIVLQVAGKYLDVYSFNNYPGIDVEKGVPQSLVDSWKFYHEVTGRPLMLTEWSFPALDGGHPGTDGGGMRVLNQEERAACFTKMQSTLFSLPYFVGSYWFCLSDQPVERGIMRVRDQMSVMNENQNYGLVNERDEVWETLTQAAAAINARACELHEKGELEFVYDDGKPEWNQPLPEKEVREQNKEYDINDLKIALVDSGWEMQYDGKMLGTFSPLIQEKIGGKNRWERANYTKIEKVRENEKFKVLDIIFGLEIKDQKAYVDDFNRKNNTKPAQYEARWRFWLPQAKTKDHAWFIAECLSVKNTDTRAWELATIFHSLSPQIGGKKMAYRRYFGGSLGWAWEEIKEERGLASFTIEEASDFRFFVRKTKEGKFTYHSDFKHSIGVELQPGEEYQVQGFKSIHFGYEAKSHTDWLHAFRPMRKRVLTYYYEE